MGHPLGTPIIFFWYLAVDVFGSIDLKKRYLHYGFMENWIKIVYSLVFQNPPVIPCEDQYLDPLKAEPQEV